MSCGVVFLLALLGTYHPPRHYTFFVEWLINSAVKRVDEGI
jgi:hypothetical protein